MSNLHIGSILVPYRNFGSRGSRIGPFYTIFALKNVKLAIYTLMCGHGRVDPNLGPTWSLVAKPIWDAHIGP